MTSAAPLTIRPVTPSDLAPLVAVADAWWGAPPGTISGQLHRTFFEHFSDTCLVATTSDGSPVGFLIGFLSQTHTDEAYIRLIAAHPGFRKAGVGRALYERFFAIVRARGRRLVRCVTSPGNTASLAFHARLGFKIEPGDTHSENGIPITTNYDGRGAVRVRLVKHLDTAPENTSPWSR
jgi:ribosomal protein S18 acetylase RimI-like enzyme